MSFFGYDNVPNGNINPNYVNVTSSNYSGNFSSNEVPKSCLSTSIGGRKIKKLKRRIKNISNIYNMKHKKKTRISKLKQSNRSRQKRSRRNRSTRNRSKRHQHGGHYSQYGNNDPSSQGYSLGGDSSQMNSALANPPMYKGYNNVIDNYNHFEGKGFGSIGH